VVIAHKADLRLLEQVVFAEVMKKVVVAEVMKVDIKRRSSWMVDVALVAGLRNWLRRIDN
jgi:hypothetical protein